MKIKYGLLLSALVLFCNSGATQTLSSKQEKKEIEKWFESQVWMQGLKLTPHKSINKGELYRQYETSEIWWDKAFEFLKNSDLHNIKPGRYIIDSGNVFAFVSEEPPQERDQVKWETHQNFNDLQYIIRGKVKMGIASRTTSKSKIIIPYDSKADIQFYSVKKGKYFDGERGTFFIFSPKDIHRPIVKAEGNDSIKKILVKVRVPE